MPIVDSRRKGRVLNFGGEKGRGRRWIGWKEANELERLSVGAVACDAVVFSNGFVECGRQIKEPGRSELGGTSSFTFSDAAGEEGKMIQERNEIFTKAPKRLYDARND